MSKLIEQILDAIPHDVFTSAELIHLLPGSDASRYNLIKRSIAKGELIHISKGIYAFSKRYQRQGINLYELAGIICGPSYISFESALSYHGLIPEAVYSVTSACFKRSRNTKTPLGSFFYTRVPTPSFSLGVKRIQSENHVFLMATPLKALADYVYAKKLDWISSEPLLDNLRIEKEELHFTSDEIKELQENYNSSRVRKFLTGLQKEFA